MSNKTTVKKDLIPYQAGVVMLIPLDANKQPDYTKAVATQRDFLTSTQTSVTRTTETLANGNGQDKEFIIDETYNLTVVGNTYNPEFHSVVAGRIQSDPTTILMPDEFTFNLPATPTDEYLEITFGEGKDHETVPAADADEHYNFIVSDSYGNTLTQGTTPGDGVYSYSSDLKALQFDESYANQAMRVIYYYSVGDGGYQIASDPVLRQPEYRIEIFGMRMSAGGGELYPFHITMPRASVTGDVTEQTTQKAKTAPITYTFASAPFDFCLITLVQKRDHMSQCKQKCQQEQEWKQKCK